jgi:hypothetical protein
VASGWTVAGATPVPAAAQEGGHGREKTVTLVTGDRVTVASNGAVSVRPGAGRAHTRFLVSREQGHIRVVPQDAEPLVRSGKVGQRLFDIPVRVERQPGAPQAEVETLIVQASYDDGKTWRNAQLRTTETGSWIAMVQHPGGSGFVSLKATATDSNGNSVEQTIIHAYRYGQTR